MEYGKKVTKKRLQKCLANYYRKKRFEKFCEKHPEWKDPNDDKYREVIEHVSIRKNIPIEEVIMKIKGWIKELG